MSTGDLIQIAILVVYAAVGIASIICSRKSIKVSLDSSKKSIDLTKESIDLTKRQIRAQMFSECTRRYNEIILNMPAESHGGTKDSEIMRHMRLYFNLCSEEYYLWDKGMIDIEVWEMWKEGMQITMNNIVYQHAWIELSGEYNSNFCTFFRDNVIEWKKNIAKSGDIETAK